MVKMVLILIIFLIFYIIARNEYMRCAEDDWYCPSRFVIPLVGMLFAEVSLFMAIAVHIVEVI